jgi:anthranilate 1,2-dioxygenase ferredoxin reductase component
MSNDAFVIVGAGHAARRAAETLRQKASDLHIVKIGDQAELPYDRPVLSKDALLGTEGEQRAFIRDASWYREQRIEMRLGVSVERIDRSGGVVWLADGTRIAYHRLLLATGSRVRRFAGPVANGVVLHYVRTVADARALRDILLPGKRVVVLGGGFIGLEVAAAAITRGCGVTLIEPAARLLQRSMPATVGDFMGALHAARGVDMRLGVMPTAIRAAAPVGAIVETDHGDLAADVVVIGIGVLPNCELAHVAGLAVDNGIVVDEYCRTADPLIFAAGEVTHHFNPLLGRNVRVESWQVAENQPAIAVANMPGGEERYAEVPWLWSDQYDCNVQTLGLFSPQQKTIMRGEPTAGAFTMLSLGADGRLEAVAAVNSGRDIGVSRRLMAAGKVLDEAHLADPATALRTLL